MLNVTGFWYGALYGEVGEEPIVLDGETGKDRQTSAGAAPPFKAQRVALPVASPPGTSGTPRTRREPAHRGRRR